MNKKIQISILNYTDNKAGESVELSEDKAEVEDRRQQKSAQKRPCELLSENESVSKEKKITSFFQKSQ